MRGGYDARRVALVGHSLGGSAASAAMVADRRIDVGVNLDGTVQIELPARGLSRPFVFVGSEEHGVPGARSMQITRAYVAATLDKHLRGVPGPMPRCPEVIFQRPVYG